MDGKWWSDLSGIELLSRLVNRGVPPTSAGALVRFRERPDTAAIIDRHLAR